MIGSDAARAGVIGAFEIAAAARARGGASVNGDAWRAHPCLGGVLLAVTDGVGHGEAAAAASRAALDCVSDGIAREPSTPLDRLVVVCHAAARPTVGLALMLLRATDSRLELCGVGNVDTRSLPTREGRGVSLAGTVGYAYRTARVFTSALTPGDLLAVFTDGIRSSFELSSPPGSLVHHAETGLREHARDRDDATLVLLRYQP